MGIYVRTIKRRNKDGSEVEYIQLAHNTRHPEKGYSRAEVVYSFGRRDQLDVAALKRLVISLSRFISPEDVQELGGQGTDLKFISSQPVGHSYLKGCGRVSVLMVDPGDSELLAFGKSKHKRDDLPQVTIRLAVTRESIPVRCWVLPGNQNDAKCVDQVQKDLNDWKLGNVIWAMDRGMTREETRRNLQRAGGQYILMTYELMSKGG
jgi:hypothetical protein